MKNIKASKPQKESLSHNQFFSFALGLVGGDVINNYITNTFRTILLVLGLFFKSLFLPLWEFLTERKEIQINKDAPKEAKETDKSVNISGSKRFEKMRKEEGLSEKDIASRVRGTFICCYMFLFMTLGQTFSNIYYADYIAKNFGFIEKANIAVIYLSSLILTFYWGYSNYCLRNKAFLGFKHWLNKPSFWLPRSKFTKALTALLLISGLFSNPLHRAYADDIPSQTGGVISDKEDNCSTSQYNNNFDLGSPSKVSAETTFLLPCEEDIFRNMLEMIVPGIHPLSEQAIIGSSDYSSGKSALANAFQVFVSLISGIAAISLTWHVVNLIISGAHEGSLLKTKWGGPWSAIKVGWGFSFLVPYFKGYCLMQVLTIYLALWSDSFGNAIARYYVNGLVHPAYSGMPTTSFNDKATLLLEESVCFAAGHDYNKDSDYPATSNVVPWEPAPSENDDEKYTNLANYKAESFWHRATHFAKGVVKFMLPASQLHLRTETWNFGTCGSMSITHYAIGYLSNKPSDTENASLSAKDDSDFNNASLADKDDSNNKNSQNSTSISATDKAIAAMGQEMTDSISAFIKELLDRDGGTVNISADNIGNENIISHQNVQDHYSNNGGGIRFRGSGLSLIDLMKNHASGSTITTNNVSSRQVVGQTFAIMASATNHLKEAWGLASMKAMSAIQANPKGENYDSNYQDDGRGDNVNKGNGQESAMSQFNQEVYKYGWPVLASFYMNISRMQNILNAEFAANGLITNPPQSYALDPDKSKRQDVAYLLQGQNKEMYEIFEEAMKYYAQFRTNDESPDNILNMLCPNQEICDTDPNKWDGKKSLNTSSVSDIADRFSQTAKNVGSVPSLTIDINTIGLDNPDSGLGGILDALDKGLGAALDFLVNNLSGYKNDAGGNKLQAMIEFGHNIITLYFLAIAGGKVVSFVSKGISVIGKGLALVGVGTANPILSAAGGIGSALGGALSKASGFIITILWIVLIVGVVHAYVLPMLPYIFFTTFVLTELVFVVSSLISTPLWMFAHIRLDGGEKFVESQQMAGYSIMFNLFLRIPVGVLAYVMSFLIFNAIQEFLSMTFYPAMQSGQAHGSIGVIGKIVQMVLMTFINWQVALRCFNLMNTVPNSVSQWIGLNAQLQDHESGSLMNAVVAGASAHLGKAQEGLSAAKDVFKEENSK